MAVFKKSDLNELTTLCEVYEEMSEKLNKIDDINSINDKFYLADNEGDCLFVIPSDAVSLAKGMLFGEQTKEMDNTLGEIERCLNGLYNVVRKLRGDR